MKLLKGTLLLISLGALSFLLLLYSLLLKKQNSNLVSSLNQTRRSSQTTTQKQQKITKPPHSKKYTNDEYNFQFYLQPFEEREKYKDWNPSYSFDFVETSSSSIRIYRIKQDATTNDIDIRLKADYSLYKTNENTKNDLASWWKRNINYDANKDYLITTFSQLPCINNTNPEIQENPVLVIHKDIGVTNYDYYYYIYFDFGTPFILGYAPGDNIACSIHFITSTISRLNN